MLSMKFNKVHIVTSMLQVPCTQPVSIMHPITPVATYTTRYYSILKVLYNSLSFSFSYCSEMSILSAFSLSIYYCLGQVLVICNHAKLVSRAVKVHV